MASLPKPELTKRKEKLERQRSEVLQEIWAIEAEERRTQSAKVVGNCYVYDNSYSSSEHWPLYLKVIGTTEHGGLKCLKFQTDCYGKIDIEPSADMMLEMLSGYEPIGIGKFSGAYSELLSKLTELELKHAR